MLLCCVWYGLDFQVDSISPTDQKSLIGTLLRRMYKTYDNKDDPNKRRKIVGFNVAQNMIPDCYRPLWPLTSQNKPLPVSKLKGQALPILSEIFRQIKADSKTFSSVARQAVQETKLSSHHVKEQLLLIINDGESSSPTPASSSLPPLLTPRVGVFQVSVIWLDCLDSVISL